MSGQERANARLAAALRYARASWPVFPCIPGEKIPATRHGFLDATTDPDKITWWWSRHPERNIAIATGLPGPDVLDVDVRPGGSGFAAFSRLRREGLLDGAGAYVRTPSGGLHAYFAGSQQSNGRLPAHHLDFRSRGGYILAPPSQVAGKPYELLKHQDGQTGLDWAAVTRLLDPQPQHQPGHAAERPTDTTRLARWVARLPEGNRNDGLFWAANRALEAGLTDLTDLAEAARTTGLDQREIARTLASAQRHPGRHPPAESPGCRKPEPGGQVAGTEAPSRSTPGRPAATPATVREPQPTWLASTPAGPPAPADSHGVKRPPTQQASLVGRRDQPVRQRYPSEAGQPCAAHQAPEREHVTQQEHDARPRPLLSQEVAHLTAAGITRADPGLAALREWNRRALHRAAQTTADRAGTAPAGEDREAEP